MSRAKRMQPAVRVAEQRELDAAKRLGESQRVLAECEMRLSELHRYQEEYRLLVQQSGAGGISAGRYQALLQFMNALDHAIVQQEHALVRAREGKEYQTRVWLQTRGKVKALGKVVERYRHDEEQDELRREQKETDEWAHRRGR